MTSRVRGLVRIVCAGHPPLRHRRERRHAGGQRELGRSAWAAWFELVPEAAVRPALRVAPGDTIAATVTAALAPPGRPWVGGRQSSVVWSRARSR
jgi:hypothetical protein